MYEIISTGSQGNAVLYFDSILVDCGVTFAKIKPFLSKIKIVLLTHEHKDHIIFSTLIKMQFEKPSLRIACGSWMLDNLSGVKNIDIIEKGIYNYGLFSIAPIKLYHDVPNFGYRIFKGVESVFHATDTAHLEGIEAKNYNLYMIEANYDEDMVKSQIQEAQMKGEFCHKIGTINSHLSWQQANDFFFKNKGENSKLIRLHESKTF